MKFRLANTHIVYSCGHTHTYRMCPSSNQLFILAIEIHNPHLPSECGATIHCTMRSCGLKYAAMGCTCCSITCHTVVYVLCFCCCCASSIIPKSSECCHIGYMTKILYNLWGTIYASTAGSQTKLNMMVLGFLSRLGVDVLQYSFLLRGRTFGSMCTGLGTDSIIINDYIKRGVSSSPIGRLHKLICQFQVVSSCARPLVTLNVHPHMMFRTLD